MPVWHIFHNDSAFTAADLQGLAEAITSLYDSFLPKFYVNVLFHPIKTSNLYVGGRPTDKFVRIQVDHIARSIKDDVQERKRFLEHVALILKPYIQDKGLSWEFNVDETPFDLWTVNGLIPPAPASDAEARWRVENI